MILVAHRGASKNKPENTPEAFLYAAQNGADILETDIRRTAEGTFILFHDDDLKRVDGSDDLVQSLTLEEMQNRLKAAKWPPVLTLSELGQVWNEVTPFLFHIKLDELSYDFINELKKLPFYFYLGISNTESAQKASQAFGRERVLAFMPRADMAEDFASAGAGIIRLWEHWENTLQDVLNIHKMGSKVFVMTRGGGITGETCDENLDTIKKLGADGVLINDVDLGAKWKSKSCFVNFAHRGASEYAPENTMEAFRMGLSYGANGIETDVQMTADGVLVLFHDNTLKRTMGIPGSVSDYTYGELLEHDIEADKIPGQKIVKLEEFFETFGGEDITFAVEIKQSGIEGEVLEIIDRLGIGEKAVVTSFDFDIIKNISSQSPQTRTGFLCDEINDKTLEMVLSISGWQICPRSTSLIKSAVACAKGRSLNVRAWGVTDEKLMRAAYTAGVDGMTVNFPDKLAKLNGGGSV